MTEHLIRLTRYGPDRNVVLLRTPPELAPQMGTFEPARYADDLRAYLLHHEAIPALYRWARFNEVHVIDERANPETGKAARTLPVECSNCGQPGRLNQPPTRCPSCGEKWSPVTPPGHSAVTHRSTTPCPNCQHAESGRFPYCSNCGVPMRHRALTQARHPVLSAGTSTPDEPLPLDIVRGEVTHVTEEALPNP